MIRVRRFFGTAVVAGGLLWASEARAQFGVQPLADPATGERYRIEFAAGYWNPTPDFVVASESLGIVGSQIDAVVDLGIAKKQVGELRLVLRPGLKHKFRLDYLPVQYEAEKTVTRDIIFNGQRYRVGLPVQSGINWTTTRFVYEYDFLYLDRLFAGLVLEAKYTDVQVELISFLVSEFARARAPIPSIGGIVRGYVAPNISITGELTGFKIPESLDERYRFRYLDFDLYGTVNFTNNVGAQLGYRSLDVTYRIEDDIGDLRLAGLYFGAVVRY